MHVVNDLSYSEPGTLKCSFDGEYLEAGTTSFGISGRGTRVIKNVLNGKNGPCTEDLTSTLYPKANSSNRTFGIVGETALCDTELFSLILAQLVRKFNIIFLQYNPVSTCYQFGPWPVNMINAHSEPAYIRDRIQHIYAQHPRTDTEELWHLRSSHLGKEALRRLVKHARGLKSQAPGA
ncbi:hypothetical protein E4U56_007607 [Claviceps arundinis]|uniref:Uncharacterized protein n=1 Tax=Claviceps arundinis TaxID=1623583 RepID=A0A9P7MVU2_9HYPO|nr:hypothetical protein E4U56_007607 [Claviceps arundinis]